MSSPIKKEKKSKRKRARFEPGDESVSSKKGKREKESRKKAKKSSLKDAGSPKIETTTKGGIVSASLEETNRLRKELGLKPLTDKKRKKKKEDKRKGVSFNASSLSNGTKFSNESGDNMKDKIEEIRALREEQTRKKHLGLTITQELEQDTAYDENTASILTWINKSRKIEKEKRQAKAKESMFDEDDELDEIAGAAYTKKDLGGLRVAHDLQQFKTGQQKIFVLKDTEILNEAGTGLNTEEDALVNTAMIEQDIIERNKNRRREGARGLVYDPYGDSLVNDLLPQYGEEKVDRLGFRLDETGEVDGEVPGAVLENLETKLKQSLDMDLTLQKDTYTQEEMISFRKRKRKPKKKKNARKKRKRENEEIPIELKYAHLSESTTVKGVDRGRREDGALAELKFKIAETKEQKRREANYRKALEKAEAQTYLLEDGTIDEEEDDLQFNLDLKAVEIKKESEVKTKDASVAETIARIKKEKSEKELKRLSEKNGEEVKAGLKFTTASAFSFGLRGAVEELNKYYTFSDEEGDDAMETSNANIPVNGSLVKEEPDRNERGQVEYWEEYTVEFKVKPLGFKMREASRSGINARIKKVTPGSQAYFVGVKEGSLISAINGKNVFKKFFVDIKTKLRKVKAPFEMTFKYNKTNVAESEEPRAFRSVRDALRIVKARGLDRDEEYDVAAGARVDQFKPVDVARKVEKKYLKWTVEEVEKWAEDNDIGKLKRTLRKHKVTGQVLCDAAQAFCERILKLSGDEAYELMAKIHILRGDPAPDINLEYLNKYTGKPMNAKQAFRDMCHQFHGKRPGKRKTEKRMRRQAAEMSRKRRGAIDTPLGVVGKIKQATMTTGKAYVVVDGPEAKTGFKNTMDVDLSIFGDV